MKSACARSACRPRAGCCRSCAASPISTPDLLLRLAPRRLLRRLARIDDARAGLQQIRIGPGRDRAGRAPLAHQDGDAAPPVDRRAPRRPRRGRPPRARAGASSPSGRRFDRDDVEGVPALVDAPARRRRAADRAAMRVRRAVPRQAARTSSLHGSCCRCGSRAHRRAARRRTASGAARARSSRSAAGPPPRRATLRSPFTDESGSGATARPAENRRELTEIVPARIGDAIGNARAVERLRAHSSASSSRHATARAAAGVAHARSRAAGPPRPACSRCTTRPIAGSLAVPGADQGDVDARSSRAGRADRRSTGRTHRLPRCGWLAAKRARISGRNRAGIIVRRAEPDRPLDLRRAEALHRLVGQLQDAPAVADQRLAVRRQDHRASVLGEKRPRRPDPPASSSAWRPPRASGRRRAPPG